MRPVAAIAQAGVLDLQRAHEEGLGGGAVDGLLGEPPTAPERFAAASPAALAPLGVAQLLVHGDADDIVPVTQSRIHAELDPGAQLVELEGADHFDVIDPSHRAWEAVVERLPSLLEAEILGAVTPPDTAIELERTIERYNEAWNAQDVELIVSFHAPGMVFENHTAGERAEGPGGPRAHRRDLRELARPRRSAAVASTRVTGSW